MKKLLSVLLSAMLLLGCAAAEGAPDLPYRMLYERVAFAFPLLPGESYEQGGADFIFRRAYFINATAGSHGYMIEIADIAPFAAEAEKNAAGQAPLNAAVSTILSYADGYVYPSHISDFSCEESWDGQKYAVTVRFSAEAAGERVCGCGILQGTLLVLGMFPEDALGLAMMNGMQLLPETKAAQYADQLFSPCEVRSGAAAVVFPCAVACKDLASEDQTVSSARYQGWLPTGEFFHFQQFTAENFVVPLIKAEAKLILREIAEAAFAPYKGENLRGLEYDWLTDGVYAVRGRIDLTRGDRFVAGFALIATKDGNAYLAWATEGDAGDAFVNSLTLLP